MSDRLLRSDAEIEAAANADADTAEPLTDSEIETLAVILAPIGEARRRKAAEQTGAA